MARIDDLNNEQAAEFGHAFIRWLVDEDPARVARFFPDLDPHAIPDSEASRSAATFSRISSPSAT